MNETSIFNQKTPLFHKLEAFGFVKSEGDYIYRRSIVQGQFILEIKVTDKGSVTTKVIDVDTNDAYVLHLNDDVVGSYVGKVRAEYYRILQDIADKCFEKNIFKSQYAQLVIQYVKQKYGDEVEYLWEKFSDNAVVRRQDNKKWYLAILTVAMNKLGLDGGDKVEIIDVRIEPQVLDNLVDGKKYFRGYHMNKKNWLTVCLDESVGIDEIYRLIDKSYLLAHK